MELIDFGIKIILEKSRITIYAPKNILELRKILEKFLEIDRRIRNTTKVVLAPKNTFGMIKEKDKALKNRNLIPKKIGKFPGKRGIALTRLKTFSKPLDF